jgi:hypothetical protein
MLSSSIVCRSFNPHSRIIQLVHIHSGCLTRRTRDLVLRQVAIELIGCSLQTFGTSSFSHGVLSWINENHPEAYPYATRVIGYSSPWVVSVDEVELLLSQKPYLYQGRLDFVGFSLTEPPATPTYSTTTHHRTR